MKISFLTRKIFELVWFFCTNFNKIRNAEICFFFPSYHTGGAEKVHLEIIRSICLEKNGVIIFTERSDNQHYRKEFEQLIPSFEIVDFLSVNLRIRYLFESTLLSIINSSRNLEIVFGANSIFYYDIVPKINPEIKKIDLIHAFSFPDYGFEDYSLSIVNLFDYRVTISDKTVQDFMNLYEKHGLSKYSERVQSIYNFCEFEPIIGSVLENKFVNLKELNIAWIGRFSKEKQPSIFLKLSKLFENNNFKINFNMVTDRYDQEIQEANVNFIGRIEDSNDMKDFLKNQHILIITSYREGLPLVFAESISQGVVVISTNVGAMSYFIKNKINGFIIPDDGSNLDYLKNLILHISKTPSSLLPIAKEGLKVYIENFDKEKFTNSYKKLLNV